jgi:hypothetical protein
MGSRAAESPPPGTRGKRASCQARDRAMTLGSWRRRCAARRAIGSGSCPGRSAAPPRFMHDNDAGPLGSHEQVVSALEAPEGGICGLVAPGVGPLVVVVTDASHQVVQRMARFAGRRAVGLETVKLRLPPLRSPSLAVSDSHDDPMCLQTATRAVRLKNFAGFGVDRGASAVVDTGSSLPPQAINSAARAAVHSIAIKGLLKGILPGMSAGLQAVDYR